MAQDERSLFLGSSHRLRYFEAFRIVLFVFGGNYKNLVGFLMIADTPTSVFSIVSARLPPTTYGAVSR